VILHVSGRHLLVEERVLQWGTAFAAVIYKDSICENCEYQRLRRNLSSHLAQNDASSIDVTEEDLVNWALEEIEETIETEHELLELAHMMQNIVDRMLFIDRALVVRSDAASLRLGRRVLANHADIEMKEPLQWRPLQATVHTSCPGRRVIFRCYKHLQLPSTITQDNGDGTYRLGNDSDRTYEDVERGRIERLSFVIPALVTSFDAVLNSCSLHHPQARCSGHSVPLDRPACSEPNAQMAHMLERLLRNRAGLCMEDWLDIIEQEGHDVEAAHHFMRSQLFRQNFHVLGGTIMLLLRLSQPAELEQARHPADSN
jgi:hypothetical protein